MRILVLSDIHANLTALSAINEPHDLCLFLGDSVDYGVEVDPCVDWLRANADHAVRGNHDHGVAQRVDVRGFGGFRYLTGVTRTISCNAISEVNRRYLAELPSSLSLTIDGLRYYLVHATPRDPFDEYAPAEVDFWQRRLDGIDADVFCVGHSHIPYILKVGEKTVLNPGSVGLPRDGIPQVSYAIIENRHIQLKRVPYDIDAAIASLGRVDLPENARLLLSEVYRTGKLEKRNGDGQPHLNGTPAVPNSGQPSGQPSGLEGGQYGRQPAP
jgi:putative phosphoesterase